MSKFSERLARAAERLVLGPEEADPDRELRELREQQQKKQDPPPSGETGRFVRAAAVTALALVLAGCIGGPPGAPPQPGPTPQPPTSSNGVNP